MAKTGVQSSSIKGWGSDLALKNRPGVPREKNHRPSAQATDAEKFATEIVHQVPTTKIFKSLEHRDLTPVFGTSCPPTGLSGILRGVAFKYSEAQLAHWLILMLADRINVFEGIFGDLARGKIPNPFAEMGLKSELKYNRPAFTKKVLVAGAAVGTAALIVWGIKKALEEESSHR